MLLTIAAFIFVLSIVIFVHEFGHFIVAKLNGVYVITFSMGFGPKLVKRRVGETEYAISAIPFGGYVKFAQEIEGDDEEDTLYEETGIEIPDNRKFRNKSPLQRISVVLAGPFMNALLAVLVYIFSYWFVGVYVNPNNVVSTVENDSPAAAAGIMPGDTVIEINGLPFTYWGEIENQLIFEEGVSSEITIRREGRNITLDLSPERDGETGLWKIGMYPVQPPRIGFVKRESPADEAGIRRGALILSINDTTVTSYEHLGEIIHAHAGIPMKFTWEFEGKILSSMITPEAVETAVESERLDIVKVGMIGIFAYYERKSISFVRAIELGGREFAYLFRSILGFLGKLFTGNATIRAVGGPLRVGVMAGDMARWGFSFLVKFLAFFSLNLAIFNMLPILPFDGGHVVLNFAELVSGRSINKKVQHAMMQIGYIILIVLMVFVLGLDIFNLFAR